LTDNLVQAALASAEIVLARCIAGKVQNGARLVAGIITKAGLPDNAQQRYVEELFAAFNNIIGGRGLLIGAAKLQKLRTFVAQFRAAANRKWPGLLR